MESPHTEQRSLAWLIVAAAGVRAALGIIVTIDAYLKWQPRLCCPLRRIFAERGQQPAWLARAVVSIVAAPCHAGRRVLHHCHPADRNCTAVGLLLGVTRRLTDIGGALFSLLIWSTAEGFGGPYTSAATNLGPAFVHVLMFIAVALFERLLRTSPYSLDYYIEQRFPR
jgi:nitrite reductase (NO-forming)